MSEDGPQRRLRQSQPVRLALPRAALRRCEEAGIFCQPTVSLEYQRLAKRHVVRGLESGGASKEIGHYVALCGPDGERLAWLQPVQSLIGNGPHAVVIAPVLVSVEVFRIEQTYELLIARHEFLPGEDGKRPRPRSQIRFRGKQGHLSLELWGRDKEAAGKIAPEFFSRSGERTEIPVRFLDAVKAATQGASTVGCRAAIFAHAPGEAICPGVCVSV